MHALVEVFRSGAWLTRERVRLVAFAVLAASAIGFGWLVVTSDGLNDIKGRPLGTDFANVYAAGTYVLEGRPAVPFDSPSQHAREKEIFGADTPFYGWHYPPFFLFVAAPLALMPYSLALTVWQGVTFALYLWSIWAILVAAPPSPTRGEVTLRRGEVTQSLWLLLAVAYPAVFVNLGHGHNGFLTAALLGGALVQLDRRPWLAGILLGLLAYKPQFGLMIPLVLAATGRWRTVAAAAVTVAALAAAATLAFGVDVWTAFLEGTRFTRIVVLEAGNTGWHKIQSVFAWVRMWGGSVPLAYAVQGATTVVVACVLAWLWRSRADFALKASALAIAALLATPYSLDYDLMVLAPAVAFLAAYGLAHGFRPYEASALAILWLTPLVARSVAQVTLIPLGVLAMLAVFSLVVSRAMAESGVNLRWRFATRTLK
jgi:Glycosyltransferase family 87